MFDHKMRHGVIKGSFEMVSLQQDASRNPPQK